MGDGIKGMVAKGIALSVRFGALPFSLLTTATSRQIESREHDLVRTGDEIIP
jgi:hypothetical protein